MATVHSSRDPGRSWDAWRWAGPSEPAVKRQEDVRTPLAGSSPLLCNGGHRHCYPPVTGHQTEAPATKWADPSPGSRPHPSPPAGGHPPARALPVPASPSAEPP